MKPLVDEPTRPEGEWSCWDDMAVEVEVAELLYGIVRVLKPRLVVESGSGRGIGSVHLAAALKDNGVGWLVTFEPDRRFAEEAARRLDGYPAEVREGSTLDYSGDAPDLLFLDSGPEYRPSELARWLPTGVRMVIHDAHRYSLSGGVMFPTQRGLWVRL